jgi:hypothetical protein
MNKQLKTFTSILLFSGFIFLGFSSGEENDTEKEKETEEKIEIGSTYSIDAYHQIQFKTSTRYWIYQKPLNCGGEGNWSQKDKKIILGPNDSNCESTSKIKGEYSISEIIN